MLTANTDEQGLMRGVLTILLAGIALGLVYNQLGLQSRRGWGLSWIGQDRVAALETMPSVAAAAIDPYATTSDDPLAIPADAGVANGLPEIPDVGRPVKIETEALKLYVDAGAAIVVDARTPEEYDEGHIAGAINLPFDEVISDPARLESLDSGGKPLVTYCGGGTCELSLSLAEELFFAGHNRVAVYMSGYPAWVEAGYPVDRGASAAERH